MTTALLAVIIIVAVALWLIPGIDPTIRKVMIALVVICFLLWLLVLLGIVGGGDGVIIYDTD
jgi:hypothetical protein